MLSYTKKDGVAVESVTVMSRPVEIAPFYIRDVPHCHKDCPQKTRRLRRDGEPSRTRPWFCAIDGSDDKVCEHSVRATMTELVKLRRATKGPD